MHPSDYTFLDAPQSTLIEFLQEEFPKGFEGQPTTIFEGSNIVELDDYDIAFSSDKDITYTIIHHPGVEALAGAIVAYVVGWIINWVIDYIIEEFAEVPPTEYEVNYQNKNSESGSVAYNLNIKSNSPKLGNPIPVLYGRARIYPTIIEKSYTKYVDNNKVVYNLMCVAAGSVTVTDTLLGDTNMNNLVSPPMISKILYQDSFDDIQQEINDTIDPDYNMRVYDCPTIHNLEVRQSPVVAKRSGTFSGNTLTFSAEDDGSFIDLSFVLIGSVFNVRDSIRNNGAYTVAAVDNLAHTITITTSFNLEPNNTTDNSNGKMSVSVSGNHVVTGIQYCEYNETFWAWNKRINPSGQARITFHISAGIFYNLRVIRNTASTKSCSNPPYQQGGENWLNQSIVSEGVNTESYGYLEETGFTIDLTTAYGPFEIINATQEASTYFEVDVVFPRGLYEANQTTGNLTPYTVDINFILRKTEPNGTVSNQFFTESITGTSKQAIRKTFRYRIPPQYGAPTEGLVATLKITRSPDSQSNYVKDDLVIEKVKAIVDKRIDTEDYGDITVLWTKTTSSAETSALNNQTINCWAEAPDKYVSDCIRDIYTRSDYGAGLPASDLIIQSTKDTVLYPSTHFTLGSFYTKEVDSVLKWRVYYNGFLVVDSTEPLIPNVGYPCIAIDSPYAGYFFGTPYTGLLNNYYKYEMLTEALRPNYHEAEFNGVIDRPMVVMDALKLLATPAQMTIFLDGPTVRGRIEEIQDIRSSLFNETNIVKDSLTISYLFNRNTTYDGQLVKYRDPYTFKEATVRHPIDAVNPQTRELVGCTDEAVALKSAKFTYNNQQLSTKTVKFSSDIQAMIPDIKDRIGVTHRFANWGDSAQVIHYDVINRTITLDDYYLSDSRGLAGQTSLVAIFRSPTGIASPEYNMTKISDNQIQFDDTTGLPNYLAVAEGSEQGAYLSLGITDHVVKDYKVLEVTSDGQGVYSITAGNYDTDLYTNPVKFLDFFAVSESVGEATVTYSLSAAGAQQVVLIVDGVSQGAITSGHVVTGLSPGDLHEFKLLASNLYGDIYSDTLIEPVMDVPSTFTSTNIVGGTGSVTATYARTASNDYAVDLYFENEISAEAQDIPSPYTHPFSITGTWNFKLVLRRKYEAVSASSEYSPNYSVTIT